MSDRQAFIDAIKAAPDDDAPRLIFADWLDEHGEEARAEFIRLECELATNDPKCLHASAPPKSCAILPKSICPQQLWCDRCKRWDYLRNRHQELVLDMLDQFYGLPPAIRSIGRWDWSRGFVESVACTAADWLKHGDTILAAHPVQVVTLTTWPAMTRGYNPRIGPDEPMTLVRLFDLQSNVWYRSVTAALNAEWPGVRFHLPETTDVRATGGIRLGHSAVVQVTR